jgi:hypothetical protein
MQYEDPLDARNVTVQKAKSINGIYISNISYEYYDEIKNNLFVKVNSLFDKGFCGGFLFDGCSFNEELLRSFKEKLSCYNVEKDELHFRECYFWGDRGRAINTTENFFKDKMSDD